MRVLFSSLLVFLSAACGSPSSSYLKEDDWEKAAWITRANRVLNYGRPLSTEEIEGQLPWARNVIVDTMMADPSFGDTVLDFNLYFLGHRPDILFVNRAPHGDELPERTYYFSLVSKSQAIASAREVMAGGNYLSLFADALPRYHQTLGDAEVSDAEDPNHNLTNAEKRQLLLDGLLPVLDQVIAAFHKDGQLDKAAGCLAFNIARQNAMGAQPVQDAGFDFNLNFDLFQYPAIQIAIDCAASSIPGQRILDELAVLRQSVVRLFALAPAIELAAYPIRGLGDLKSMDAAAQLPALGADQFGFYGFWYQLPNSSTNRNRKRAAYMLKTYFCDDLTPINVANPGPPHGDGQHASDPGCQACHYKLDPMAGFFKNNGFLGVDFDRRDFIVFDDDASLSGAAAQAYFESWPEIGYIRSLRDPSQNTYGHSLKDLFPIIRTAPEVKQCLVRRLAEYVLGKNLVFDQAWLNHLGQHFARESNSSAAFKNIVKELVLSRTFSTPDPQPDECYDHFPDQDPDPEALPCAVSYIVQTNCTTCHSSTSPLNGGLDLSRWVEVGHDGNGAAIMGFPHLDGNGQQRLATATLGAMVERLSSTDPNKAMPLNRDMKATDRARLYLWATDRLKELTQP